MDRCENCTCAHYTEDLYGDRSCVNCGKEWRKTKTFSEQMLGAYTTIEERLESLEKAVKRLNRELGLK